MTGYKTESFMEDKVSQDFGNRWMDRQMDRWKDRWTHRQKDTYTNGDTQTNGWSKNRRGTFLNEMPVLIINI